MKIIYLCPTTEYFTKMDRNRFHTIQSLSNNHQVAIGGEGWQTPELIPDLYILYKSNINTNILKTITYNEMNNFNTIKKEIKEINPSFIICHHKNEITQYKKEFPNIPFYNIPHCAEYRIFRSLNLPKIIDFCLIGKLSKIIYPLRERFYSTIIPELQKQNFQCYIHKHPSYEINNAQSGQVIEDYVKIINQSKICLTCSSVYKYRLSKYAEIPLCNSVIAGDIPTDETDFFRQFVIEIDMKMSDDEIVNRLIQAIRTDEWKEKTILGRQLTLATSTQEHYCEQLVNISQPRIFINIKKFPVLDLRKYTPTRHSIWLEDQQIKIPFQENGMITKNIKPRGEYYLRNSIRHELTMFHYLSVRNMSPKVGDIVFFEKIIHEDGREDDYGAYGFEFENANLLPKLPYTINDIMHYMQSLPIEGSAGAWGDLKKHDNTINGYLIDVRRTCSDMLKWTDKRTLLSVPDIVTKITKK